MKIIFLTRSFIPNIGGVQKHILKISQQAINHNHKVSVITEGHPILKVINSIGKTKIYYIPFKKNNKFKKFYIWAWMIKNKKIIKEADIIHAHDVGFWIIPIRMIFPKKKIYITFHGYEPDSYFRIKNIIEKKIAEKLSNGSIAVGKYLKKYYKISPKNVIYGASDAVEYFNYKKNVYDACFIGRLEADTGIKKYLEVIKKIKNENRENLKIIVCGSGSLLGELRNFTDKNKLSVIFTGWTNNPHKYISESKMVFASQYLSIIDAAQLKKMIFSIYDTEIKKDYLLSLPIRKEISVSNNVNNLSEEIIDFLKNQYRYKSRIEKAYNWASKQTWVNIYKKYLSLWEN